MGISHLNLYNSGNMFPEINSSTSTEYSEALQSSTPSQNDVESMIPENSAGDEFVNDVISNELSLDHKAAPTVVDDLNISTDDIVTGMSSGDADMLYASLEQKSLVKE